MINKHNINAFFTGFRLFVKSSWISILFIALILVLVSQVDQGASLVIHLLDHNPINLLVFIILVNAFSIVVSHYPTYIQTWQISNSRLEEGYEDGLQWFLTKYSLFGMGIITYRFSKNKTLVERISLSLRRLLGIILHLTILYIFFKAYDKFILSVFQGYHTTMLFFFGVITVYFYLRIEKKVPKMEDAELKKMVRFSTILFWVIIGLTIAVVITSWLKGWSAASFYLFVILEMLSIIGFILFRNVRLHLNRKSVSVFPLNIISQHQNYLLMLAMVGWLAIGTMLLANVKVFAVSPITLILAAFYVIYGMIIIPIKHSFYYKSTKDAVNNSLKRVFVYLTPFMFLGLIGVSYLAGLIGNDLHRLSEVDYVSELVVREKEFMDSMTIDFSLNANQKNMYYIASYGGGLKANYWNLLLLEELSSFNNVDLLQQTVAMSGVSGGALGQAFYGSLYKQKISGDNSVKDRADEIGVGNFLSVDIAYTLGWDLLREMYVGKKHFSHPDRSGKAMIEYSKIIGDTEMDGQGYQEYWKSIRQGKGHFPLLITNSTGIQLKRGIACSVELSDFKSAFPSATNILKLSGDKTLTFNGAVSSTNRFPILSPTAKVRGKGHFLDGGYFDNSGMLSLQNLHSYFYNIDPEYGGNKKKVFVQIFNSKSEYIRYVLSDVCDDLNYEESASGEIQAIVNVVTSIELLPRYIESYFENAEGVEYLQVHLPYKISIDDVNDFLGGKMSENAQRIVMIEISESNAWIDEVLSKNHDDWDVTEPPLGRLIGGGSVNYMKAFIEDGRIFEDLEDVVGNGDKE